MAKTALITGATGFLGRQVTRAFQRAGWTAVGTGYTRAKPPSILKVDLSSVTEVTKVLDDVKPEVVVHCKEPFSATGLGNMLIAHYGAGAANRFPDRCDADPEGTRALNIGASRSLAAVTASRSILLIYISTDYVFPGTPGDAPYEVTHTPKPPNLYGETKLEGEKAVLEEYKNAGMEGWAAVLRVPVLYGEAESPSESAVNVLMDAVWKAQQRDSIVPMEHWAIRYPTNTEDVGRVCQDIVAQYISAPDKTVLPLILQFSSEDNFTKYEICQLFAEIMGLSAANIKPNTEGNDPKASVQRPYDCHLSTRALKDIGIDVATQEFKGWWRRECKAFRR